jgi:hypothetical protein
MLIGEVSCCTRPWAGTLSGEEGSCPQIAQIFADGIRRFRVERFTVGKIRDQGSGIRRQVSGISGR